MLGDACKPLGRQAEMDGGTLVKRDSCSLISSNIRTWTRAAPGHVRRDLNQEAVMPSGSSHSLEKQRSLIQRLHKNIH